MDDYLTRYLSSLAGSWAAFAEAHAGARLLRGDGYLALLDPEHPVLTNVAVLAPRAVPEALGLLRGHTTWAVWSWDPATAEVLADQGLRRDVTTRPMLARLDDVDPPQAQPPAVARDADPGRVAELNGADPELLRGVPGLRAYLTADGESGLVLLPRDGDVNVSMVATRPRSRGRGLAGSLVKAALHDMRGEGYETATLQSTPQAVRLYARLGFAPLAVWQEWVG
ncbi:GNAT family N-acetyltransferase [Motilibacter aurantiacus]|uniref:GNAT family N-acetyltransferase n=1 Tax=Motilibacter aurantiacus TaxID=2714955 RepID=UPI00140E3377|nr:GNAT family N-acetyltransferase [Motilibacter aurantiacus]NHC46885.1 GNAT family N-acetyltransferase [Motilibacter aurantiacus]